MTLIKIKDIWVGNSRLLPRGIHGVPQIAMNASPARQPLKGAAGSCKLGQKSEKEKKTNPEKKGYFLPNCTLAWKSFYSCLLLLFPPSFSYPSSSRWVSALGGHIPPSSSARPSGGFGAGCRRSAAHLKGGHVAMWAMSHCNGDHDTWGWNPPSAEEQSLTLDVDRVVVSQNDKHPTVTNKIFWSGLWLTQRSKCFQPLIGISEQYCE